MKRSRSDRAARENARGLDTVGPKPQRPGANRRAVRIGIGSAEDQDARAGFFKAATAGDDGTDRRRPRLDRDGGRIAQRQRQRVALDRVAVGLKGDRRSVDADAGADRDHSGRARKDGVAAGLPCRQRSIFSAPAGRRRIPSAAAPHSRGGVTVRIPIECGREHLPIFQFLRNQPTRFLPLGPFLVSDKPQASKCGFPAPGWLTHWWIPSEQALAAFCRGPKFEFISRCNNKRGRYNHRCSASNTSMT